MAQPDTIAGSINPKGKYPKLSAIKKDPEAAALLSKMVPENTRSIHRRTTYGYEDMPAEGLSRQVSDQTLQSITDASNIFQLLPDTELAVQILVSSILSPKDMMSVELGYTITNNDLEGEVTGPMLEVIKHYFEETYKIQSDLPKILEAALFREGSYPVLILPESSIDEIINRDARVSLESLGHEVRNNGRLTGSIGLLGPSKLREGQSWSFESLTGPTQRLQEEQCYLQLGHEKINSLFGSTQVRITDNLDALKFPALTDKLRSQRIGDLYRRKRVSTEARDVIKINEKKDERVSDDKFANDIYPRRNYRQRLHVDVKTAQNAGRETNGHPVVMRLPPEAVIPVHVPSDPSDHIGYFVLLDQHGNPLSRVQETDYFKQLTTNLKQKDISSDILRQAFQSSIGGNPIGSEKTLEESEAIRLYARVVEKDLLARLKNGVYGDNLEIGRPLQIYRVMLARALANMGTQVLYVPAELVTYFAFDYNQSGVGKSLLENNKLLASIRSVLRFSNTLGAIKNSTSKTSLNITLDPADPDPSKTVETMVNEYMRTRSAAYPLGASSPADIVDFLQYAGMDVQVSGNPAYPETRMETQEHNSQIAQIDDKLTDEVKSDFFMGLGLSPETIDATRSVEFATSVVTSNLLLAKRTMLHQDTFLPQVHDFVNKYTRNSSILMAELHAVYEQNKSSLDGENKDMTGDQVIDLFLTNLEITLPRPDTAKLENQYAQFQSYTTALTDAVNAYLSDDMFRFSEWEDIEQDVPALRAAVIAYYQREWLRDNNVLSELQELTTIDGSDTPVLDMAKVQSNHMELVGKSLGDLLKVLQKARKKRDDAAAKAGASIGGDAAGDEGGDPDNAFDVGDGTDDAEGDGEDGADDEGDDAATDTDTDDAADDTSEDADNDTATDDDADAGEDDTDTDTDDNTKT